MFPWTRNQKEAWQRVGLGKSVQISGRYGCCCSRPAAPLPASQTLEPSSPALQISELYILYLYIYISIISYIYIYISYIYIYIYTYLIPHKPLCPSLHTRSSRSPRMPQHAIGRLRRSSEHGGRGSVFKRARLRKGFKQKRSAMASCASFGPSALPKASRHFLLSSCLGPTLLSLVMYHSSMSPCFSLS